MSRESDTNADSINTKNGTRKTKYAIEEKPVWKYLEGASRSQEIKKCKNCKDTAFVLLIDKKDTGCCCRCGEEFN